MHTTYYTSLADRIFHLAAIHCYIELIVVLTKKIKICRLTSVPLIIILILSCHFPFFHPLSVISAGDLLELTTSHLGQGRNNRSSHLPGLGLGLGPRWCQFSPVPGQYVITSSTLWQTGAPVINFTGMTDRRSCCQFTLVPGRYDRQELLSSTSSTLPRWQIGALVANSH